jgi:hypothetical protein
MVPYLSKPPCKIRKLTAPSSIGSIWLTTGVSERRIRRFQRQTASRTSAAKIQERRGPRPTPWGRFNNVSSNVVLALQTSAGLHLHQQTRNLKTSNT